MGAFAIADDILSSTPEEWAETLAKAGFPRYRAKQVFGWIHSRGELDPSKMGNLPKPVRAFLSEQLNVAKVTHTHRSSDGTRKLLVTLSGGKDVETVLIPQLLPADEDGAREPGEVVTQCISSQVGCAMGCGFCASGVAGLKRNMSAGEIISQLLLAKTELTGDERVRNVVLMGMGEPLHNYPEVKRAIELMSHPDGIALSPKRVTLSTSGLAKEIDMLGQDFGGRVQLALSLHAPDDERRSKLMPINRKYPLAAVVGALKRYPLPKRRRITIEYTLIRDFNDKLEDADAIVRLLRGVPIKVNLIPMNPIDASDMRAPDPKQVLAFQARIRDRGVSAFVRKQRGDDVDAACGQLALHGEAPRKKHMRVIH